MCHPITAPVTVKLWAGSPPLWFVSGQDQIMDGAKIVAKIASSRGAPVFFHEHELMIEAAKRLPVFIVQKGIGTKL
jgi:hypothetical protein